MNNNNGDSKNCGRYAGGGAAHAVSAAASFSGAHTLGGGFAASLFVFGACAQAALCLALAAAAQNRWQALDFEDATSESGSAAGGGARTQGGYQTIAISDEELRRAGNPF
jgi:hypothetical protein